MNTVYTMGSDCWTPRRGHFRVIEALRSARIRIVVDVRHSLGHPSTAMSYRRKPRSGCSLGTALRSAKIRHFSVSKRGKLEEIAPGKDFPNEPPTSAIPIWLDGRTLGQIAELIATNPASCCILCSCPVYDNCHRRFIAEAVQQQCFSGLLGIGEITANDVIRLDRDPFMQGLLREVLKIDFSKGQPKRTFVPSVKRAGGIVGYVQTTYFKILETFGQPAPSIPISCCPAAWGVEFDDDTLARIYVYKHTEIPLDQYMWHVGGRSLTALYRVA